MAKQEANTVVFTDENNKDMKVELLFSIVRPETEVRYLFVVDPEDNEGVLVFSSDDEGNLEIVNETAGEEVIEYLNETFERYEEDELDPVEVEDEEEDEEDEEIDEEDKYEYGTYKDSDEECDCCSGDCDCCCSKEEDDNDDDDDDDDDEIVADDDEEEEKK